nr:serine-rich adhesin for platelets-like [Lytechinus pictus]
MVATQSTASSSTLTESSSPESNRNTGDFSTSLSLTSTASSSTVTNTRPSFTEWTTGSLSTSSSLTSTASSSTVTHTSSSNSDQSSSSNSDSSSSPSSDSSSPSSDSSSSPSSESPSPSSSDSSSSPSSDSSSPSSSDSSSSPSSDSSSPPSSDSSSPPSSDSSSSRSSDSPSSPSSDSSSPPSSDSSSPPSSDSSSSRSSDSSSSSSLDSSSSPSSDSSSAPSSDSSSPSSDSSSPPSSDSSSSPSSDSSSSPSSDSSSSPPSDSSSSPPSDSSSLLSSDSSSSPSADSSSSPSSDSSSSPSSDSSSSPSQDLSSLSSDSDLSSSPSSESSSSSGSNWSSSFSPDSPSSKSGTLPAARQSSGESTYSDSSYSSGSGPSSLLSRKTSDSSSSGSTWSSPSSSSSTSDSQSRMLSMLSSQSSSETDSHGHVFEYVCAWPSHIVAVEPVDLAGAGGEDSLLGPPDAYPCYTTAPSTVPSFSYIIFDVAEPMFVRRIVVYMLRGVETLEYIMLYDLDTSGFEYVWEVYNPIVTDCDTGIISAELDFNEIWTDSVALTFNGDWSDNGIEVDAIQVYGTRSTPSNVRIVEGDSLTLGRIEVFDPSRTLWGTVCRGGDLDTRTGEVLAEQLGQDGFDRFGSDGEFPPSLYVATVKNPQCGLTDGNILNCHQNPGSCDITHVGIKFTESTLPLCEGTGLEDSEVECSCHKTISNAYGSSCMGYGKKCSPIFISRTADIDVHMYEPPTDAILQANAETTKGNITSPVPPTTQGETTAEGTTFAESTVKETTTWNVTSETVTFPGTTVGNSTLIPQTTHEETTLPETSVKETTVGEFTAEETTPVGITTAETTLGELPAAETTPVEINAAKTTLGKFVTAQTTSVKVTAAETTLGDFIAAETTSVGVTTSETTSGQITAVDTTLPEVTAAETTLGEFTAAETTLVEVIAADTTLGEMTLIEVTEAETTLGEVTTAELTSVNTFTVWNTETVSSVDGTVVSEAFVTELARETLDPEGSGDYYNSTLMLPMDSHDVLEGHPDSATTKHCASLDCPKNSRYNDAELVDLRGASVSASTSKVNHNPERAFLQQIITDPLDLDFLHDNHFLPDYADFNGWRAKDDDTQQPFIQVEFDRVVTIQGMAILGGQGSSARVETLKVAYSDTRKFAWKYIYEDRSTNPLVFHLDYAPGYAELMLNPWREATALILFPQTWKDAIWMRIFIVGATYDGGPIPFGMESGQIGNALITASSYLDEDHAPGKGRLNGPSSWCAASGDSDPWIKIDLTTRAHIDKFLVQGLADSSIDHPAASGSYPTELKFKASEVDTPGNEFFFKMDVQVGKKRSRDGQ